MSGKKLNSVDLYKLGYDAHYSSNRLDVAYALYNRVIEVFPDSAEARYASQQIPNITSKNPSTVPNVEEANVAIETGVVKRLATPVSEAEKTYYSQIEESKNIITTHTPSIWVSGLRIVAWINLISGAIGGFVTAYQVGETFADWGQDINWGLFFITLIAILVVTFLTTAVIMVFLDMAADISITKQSNLDILKTLKQTASSSKEK